MNAFKRLAVLERKSLIGWTSVKRYSNASDLVPATNLGERRNYLFMKEQKRQLEEIGRVEKISVEVTAPLENIVMVMNQGTSTPYDCAKHITKGFCQQAPLALINNEVLWDMHRPLPGNCTVKFLSFKDEDTYSLNHVFWRTGSFVLGAVLSRAFKENCGLLLHSFPPPHVKSGSFVYDVKLNLPDWKPTISELKVLSAEFLSFVHQNLKIERLRVKKSIAFEMFEGNRVKQQQLSQIASESEDNLVTVYKVGDHIDLSCGPMVANTSFFGRCAVAAVHKIHSKDEDLYRVQAVALPKGIMLNYYAFDILLQRAQHLNRSKLPDYEDNLAGPIEDIRKTLIP